MRLFVLLSTLDERVEQVPEQLLPPMKGVCYVICWQRTRSFEMIEALERLQARVDTVVVTLEGKGLSRSRNYAIQKALEYLDDSLEDAVFLIADDDERFMPEAFARIRATYEGDARMDGALFRLRSTINGTYFKDYPSTRVLYGHHSRSYYPASWEMTFRTRVWHMGLRFNERFGLGADVLCSGEEDVLLTDALRKGLHIWIIPEDIAYTSPVTTGSRQLDSCVLKSKGAVYGYRLTAIGAFFRCLREALSLAVKKRIRPWPLFHHLWSGVRYIRS